MTQTKTKLQGLQSDLKSYKRRFPDETFVEISLALVGENTLTETINDAKSALRDDDAPLTETQISQLKEDINLLGDLQENPTELVQMRQYGSDVDAAEVNERAVNGGAMSLAAHGASIVATLQGQVFDIGEKNAFIYNIEPQPSGMFSVKVGRWKGTLGIDIFDEDIQTHLENEFFDDNWYTPDRLRNESNT